MSDSLHSDLSTLTSTIDTLTSSLTPLLSQPLPTSTSQLSSLTDKAKLHVLTTYALESILFSYLRLNGVDAKSHPIFAELARVKSYFSKISAAEKAASADPSARISGVKLDPSVAKRFVTQGLAGNEAHDRERKGREEAGRKKRKHIKFSDEEEREEGRKRVRVVSAEDAQEDSEEEGEGEGSEDGEVEEVAEGIAEKGKRERKRKGKGQGEDAAEAKRERARAKKERRRARREKEEREGEMQ